MLVRMLADAALVAEVMVLRHEYRLYVLFVIHVATRRVHILGVIA